MKKEGNSEERGKPVKKEGNCEERGKTVKKEGKRRGKGENKGEIGKKDWKEIKQEKNIRDELTKNATTCICINLIDKTDSNSRETLQQEIVKHNMSMYDPNQNNPAMNAINHQQKDNNPKLCQLRRISVFLRLYQLTEPVPYREYQLKSPRP